MWFVCFCPQDIITATGSRWCRFFTGQSGKLWLPPAVPSLLQPMVAGIPPPRLPAYALRSPTQPAPPPATTTCTTGTPSPPLHCGHQHSPSCCCDNKMHWYSELRCVYKLVLWPCGVQLSLCFWLVANNDPGLHVAFSLGWSSHLSDLLLCWCCIIPI